MKKILISLMLIFTGAMYPGFSPDTLVQIADNFIQIKNLKLQDEVVTSSTDGQKFVSEIDAQKIFITKKVVQVQVGEHKLVTSCSQKFYVVPKSDWVEAQDLVIGNTLLTAEGSSLEVQSIEIIDGYRKLYDISLQKDHVFLVTESKILAHNFVPVFIGIAFAFGEGAIVFESVCIGVGLGIGLWAGIKACGSKEVKAFVEPEYEGCNSPQTGLSLEQNRGCSYSGQHGYVPDEGVVCCVPADNTDQYFLLKEKDKNKNGCLVKPSAHEPGKSCGAKSCIPKKGPHGYHIPSDKHHPNSVGKVSPGLDTEEGQEALDTSIQVIDKKGNIKKQRVCVWNGEYIVFEPTSKNPDVWHSHSRPWTTADQNHQGLNPDMQKSLQDAGMVNGKKGKIVKDMKKTNKN